jgi:hypothetical protein
VGLVTPRQFILLKDDDWKTLAGPFTTQAAALAAAQTLAQTYTGDITACLVTEKPVKILQRAVSVTATDVP